MKTIKLIKNRSDIGAGTRGADMGIDAIEIAAINKSSKYFNNYPFEDIETENETIYNKVNNSFAKRIGNVVNICTRLSNCVSENLKNNFFPIVLSGDHSSALGTISGIKAAYSNKRIGVVWIDAHADIHSPYTSPSGNVHGMPLAAALNYDNLGYKINTVQPETEVLWNKMKNIGCHGQKIHFEDLIYFGVRDTEEPEDVVLLEKNIKNYTVSEMRYRGFEICLKEAVDKLSHCDLIYISFDVDSMDCDIISKGTGTPVSKGFDQSEALKIINAFVATKKVACFEVVEVNPTLDNKGNKMAETAFDILNETTDALLKVL